MEKSYKTSKKKYIYYKNIQEKKTNILKFSSNKK